MQLLVITILLISTIGTIVSLLMLLRYQPKPSTHLVSLRHLALLILVYLTLISSFAILYTGIELVGIQVIEGETTSIIDIIYFSAITMLSVGYGDIVPVDGANICDCPSTHRLSSSCRICYEYIS
ncbi:ion channel [Bacillus sp. JCM 19034]|uniref:ion channel n=1 Tax=Bacillus sp. JCM 19034 TaxID=1481928 RepID=UPI0007824C8E|nr:ion channel [Bacillus sp. JCM 19034]